MQDSFTSPSQLVGYLTLVLGVTAFLQRSDQRLRFLTAFQSIAYAVHFFLLGNLTATASASLSSVRSFLSLRFRHPWLAGVFIAITLTFGACLARHPHNWLPVAGSVISTYAIFCTQGVVLRSLVLISTMLWLTNNILSGSVGGTVLEILVATANASTIARMIVSERKQRSAQTAPAERADCR